MASAEVDLVTIGKIEKPFGVRGAVKVRSLSDVPGRFERLKAVSVVGVAGEVTNRTVNHVRQAGTAYILQFDGITTPEAAGMLRGALIQVPPAEPSVRQEDVLYECDLIGMMVDDEEGHELGTIDRVWELPGHHVFVVRKNGRELLIPAARHFVRAVDLVQGRMTVRTSEGLIEGADAL
ncbi:ribosome maturation factor RimM [Petrachloros mirabilis]